MSKLLLIDGNAILHRAFHAIPPLTTPNQEPINAVYGFVSILLNVIQNLKPTHLAVCFDEKEKTFRHIEFPEYQSQRPPTHDDLSSQFGKARDFLKASNIPIYSKSGFEADDVIGTIATKAANMEDRGVKPERKNENRSMKFDRTSEFNNQSSFQSSDIKHQTSFNEIVIITGDRDILQLVDDKKNIKLFMPVGGLSNGKIYGEAETIERMGVPPSQIVDLKALTGDSSDNYFGVRGIGPKTAINLLQCYVTLKQIYKNLDKISEKVREKLIKGEKDAQMSYKLATIVKDVPVKIDFDEMDKWNLGSNEVLKLFQEFGFKTLTQRIISVSKKIDDEKQGNLF
ncbi:MAG: 5'-3' exonuclease H3TH domain-containing protein [bacterium]|nr:5'-3' exonuclease H3TH domain-containing protein [bacterium]